MKKMFVFLYLLFMANIRSTKVKKSSRESNAHNSCVHIIDSNYADARPQETRPRSVRLWRLSPLLHTYLTFGLQNQGYFFRSTYI